jgi:MFS family permease
MTDRLVPSRFVLMFGYSFTVFLSLFQLLPVAPYRVLALGGPTAVAGFFHAMLTFSSAASAAFTGVLVDRIGHRLVLIVVSLMLACLAAVYALISDYHVLFIVALAHGTIWSALLSASSAYMMTTIPEARRAEGLGYWGLASVVALGTAPAIGFYVYQRGWAALCVEASFLNVVMAAIAWRLPDDRAAAARLAHELGDDRPGRSIADLIRSHVEWRILVVAAGLTLMSFGYGGLTSFSALFADAHRISPASLFLTAMAAAILAGRLALGRTLDRLGATRVLVPTLLLPALGLFLLAMTGGRRLFAISGLVYGTGFGLAYPTYAAFLVGHVPPARRGAAFGAILAAFDTGIGLGASVTGWLIEHLGFRTSFMAAGVLAVLSLPYFLTMAPTLEGRRGDGPRGRP